MLACASLSCTDKCVSTKVANTGCIDAFGIRFGTSIMIANKFAIAMLGLNALRHFERRLLQKPNTAAKLALPLLRLGNRTLIHYCDVLLTNCCGVTLFHPHPCGADLMSALRILMFPVGNRLLVIKMNF
jgi:hypothetical protein